MRKIMSLFMAVLMVMGSIALLPANTAYADATSENGKISTLLQVKSESSRQIILVRKGSEALGVQFKGDEAGATPHRFTYAIAGVKDTDKTAGYCITPFARGTTPNGEQQTLNTVPFEQLDETDKKLLGIMMAGYPNKTHGWSDADEYKATHIAVQHFVFQHTDKYPNTKGVKFNDDSWSHWANEDIINLAKDIYNEGISNPYNPESSTVGVNIEASNDGNFQEVGSNLELTLDIIIDGTFTKGKLTFEKFVIDMIGSNPNNKISIGTRNAAFKTGILGTDDNTQGIEILPGDTKVKITLDKSSAESYMNMERTGDAKNGSYEASKEIIYSFEVVGGTAKQAYKCTNANSRNQDYIVFAPGETQPIQQTLMMATSDIWTFDEPEPDPGTGGLKILKYNKKTNSLVAGAIFEIRGVSASNWDFLVQIQASAGAAIPLPDGGTAITGLGSIELNGIRPGQYQITEISPPPNFDYCDFGVNSQVVTVIGTGDSGLFPQVRFENNPFASLTIKKIDSVTGAPVNGAVLRIRNPLADFDVEKTTMNGGVIELKNLPEGNYEISEVYAPEGYVLSDEVKMATLRWGENTEVTFKNTPKTELYVKKIDSETGKALDGAIFQLTKPDTGDVWEDITYYDGYAIFSDIPAGTYTLKEIKAPEGYILDVTERTIVLQEYKTTEIYIQNDKKPGLIIRKYDEDTGELLPNAEFRVAKMSGQIVYEGMTSADGTIRLEDLASEWYKITEIAAPKGYLIATEPKDVFFEPNTVLEVKFDNRRRPALEILKVDSQTNKPLAGAIFHVKKTEDATVSEYTTDASGKITIIDLEEAIYSVVEVKAPDGYLLDPQHKDIELEWGKTKQLIFTNQARPALEILKIDEATNKPLEGAKFRVTQTENNTTDEYVTDSSGSILLTDLDDKIYSIEEIVAPDGYILETQHKDIELEWGKTKQVVFTNKEKPKLRILKVDAVTGEPLANAEFRVTKVEDKTVSEYITNASGEILIEKLDEAVYKVEEFMPPDGYILYDESKEIALEWGQTKTLKFDNIRKPTMIITKLNGLTNLPVPGATYKVEYVAANGGTVTLGSYLTDANGQIIIPKVNAGWYTVTETKAAPGFSLPSDPVTRLYLSPGENAYLSEGISTGTEQGTYEGEFTVMSGNDFTPTLGANDELVYNWPLNSIVIKKTHAVTGELLAGAAFELYRADQQVSGVPGTNVGRFTTNNSGIIVIEGLSPGYYVVREAQAPQNFMISENSMQNGFLKADGTTVLEFTFANFPYGSILITKVDTQTLKPLPNARFRVTDDTGAVAGNSNGEFITNENGEILIENLKPGAYVVTEIEAPEFYTIDTTPQTVNVGTDGKTYKVSFKNQPSGTLVIRKLDTASKAPLEDAEFKVTTSSGNVVGTSNGIYRTDATGTITIPHLPKGSYTIEETKAPDGYVLENKTQTIDIDYGKTYTVDIYNKKMSSLQIIKIDSATKQPLKHAQFTVYKANGEIVGRYETDADGVIIVDALDPGWYKAVETKAPDGYLIDEVPKDFEIKANQFVQLIFENNPMSGLLVRKVDAETLAPLSGMEFTVKTMAGLLIGNYRTDADGTKLIPELEPGWYTVTETKAPDGYSLGYGDNTQTVEITHSKLVVIEFRNKPFGSIVIKKIDEITGAPLADANFTVTHQNGGLIGEYTTGSDGTVSIPNMDTGWYVISETKAPTGYTLDETAKTVEVKAGVPTVATFTNKPHSGIEIVKLDAVSHIPLQGATFTVERANGEKIGTYKTDVSGKIIVPDLTEDTYIVSETIAPDGYMLTESPKTVVVVSGKLTTVQFVNKPFSGIQIIKTDSVSHAPLSGATFTVVRDNGERIGQYKTDASGKSIVNDLAEGTYVVSETIAPDGYMLNEVPKTVVVKTGRLTTVEFENTPFSSLVIKKTDEITGNPLSGADFTVNHQNGAFVGDYTTDSDGTITIPVIEPGWYVIKETRAPNGYELNSTAKTAEVKSFVPTVVTFTNRPHSGIEIIKIDAVNKAPLMGATFTVERSNGEKVGTYKTDAAGKIIVSDLAEGTYIVSETIAPDGYMLTETPKTVVVTSGKLSSVEFVNKPYSGIEILKLDTITNLPLSGATFTVERDNGEKIGAYKTDLAGKIIVPDLAEGTYIVSETIAPDGYVRDEAPKTVVVKTGKLTAVEFRNKPLSGIEILKIDAITKAPLMGATFTVECPNGEKLGTYKTDQAGKIIVPDLAEGVYVVSETIAPDGYMLTETPKTVTVVSGKLTMVEFVNKPFSGIQIIKLNAESKAPLPGVSFLIERDNGERIGTYKTDSTGKIIVSDLAEGTYIVSETAAPDGFILDEAPKTVIVKSGKLTTVEFFNKPLAGLKIIKLDSATRQPIEGVEFVITKMSGEKIENDFRGYSFKTDRTGQIYIPNLTNGYYTVTETRSADGYILDGEPKTVLVESGKPTILEVFNTPMSGLLIVKTDAQTGKPLQGVVFDVRRADGSYVAGSILDGNQPNTAYNSPNKTTAPNGDITGSYTTDANGRIQINGLEAGQYMVTERKQLDGYELDTNVYDVTVVPGKLATLQLKNKPLSGLRIKKIDSVTGAPIYNTEFMVFDNNGKVVGTFYTDNAGVIDFSAILTEGRYTIRETRVSEGYYIDDVPKTVEFVAGKITEIEWKNTPCMGQIQITKLSADENEVNGLPAGTPLEGAIFEVYSYKSGNLVDRFVTASSGKGVSKPLPLGRYTVKEVQAPAYYQLNNKELDITIEFATQIIKLEYTNRSANTGVTIKKTGNAEAMPGDLIRYDIKKVSNDSTIPLTDFFWRDVLPVDAVRLNKIITGTYNQSLRYKIMAITNKGNTKIIADNLPTTVNNVIDCSSASLGLYSDEFVTSFTLVFGNVKAGFTCVEQPQVFVNVSKNLPNGYEFANKCDTGGKTGNEWIISSSTWLTKIFRSTNDKLPKTGF